MARFKIGDHVKINNTEKTGVIKSILEEDPMYGFWSDGINYVVRLDDGDGALTCAESALEEHDHILPEGYQVKCECGASSVGVQKHSDYCPLYRKF